MKLLKTDCFSDDESEHAVKRFFNEARAIADINHPNVVKIVESSPGVVEGVPYIVMEYAPGTSLRQFRRKPDQPDRRQKVLIIRQIGAALRAIHEKNIIHRDIKPDNIIIGDDLTVKITDFGIAHLPYSDLTGTYDLLGTPKYLSPESYTTARIDHRSDIFSLGVIAYELLVGRHPFHAHSVPVLENRIRVELPEAPVRIIPDFPLSLQAILAKMLRKDPGERYQSAAELVAEIDDYLEFGGDATIALPSNIRDWR